MPLCGLIEHRRLHLDAGARDDLADELLRAHLQDVALVLSVHLLGDLKREVGACDPVAAGVLGSLRLVLALEPGRLSGGDFAADKSARVEQRLSADEEGGVAELAAELEALALLSVVEVEREPTGLTHLSGASERLDEAGRRELDEEPALLFVRLLKVQLFDDLLPLIQIRRDGDVNHSLEEGGGVLPALLGRVGPTHEVVSTEAVRRAFTCLEDEALAGHERLIEVELSLVLSPRDVKEHL